MRIIRAKDYDDMSRKAANIISAQLILQPHCVLGLATGSSPLGAYQQLIGRYNAGDIDFSQTVSINLDEYVGLAPNNAQSYRYFMNTNLFSHINIPTENTFVPNGLAANSAEECSHYENVIKQHGGIDLQLLGLGINGHIGFNEPAAAFEGQTHKVALTESTIKANQRFFENEADVPRFAYTMGTGTIMRAKHILIIASGEGKAEAVKNTISGPITPQLPASILQLHPTVTLVADEAALSLCVPM